MTDFVREYYYLQGKVSQVLVKSEAQALGNYGQEKPLMVWVDVQEPRPVVYSSSAEWISWRSDLDEKTFDTFDMATDAENLYQMYRDSRESVEKHQGIRVAYVDVKKLTISRQTETQKVPPLK